MSPTGKVLTARQQPAPGTVLPPLPEVVGESPTDPLLENLETDDDLEGPNPLVAGTDLAAATAPWSGLQSPLISPRSRSNNLLVGIGPCWAGGLPEVEAMPQPLAYAPPTLCGLCCHCPPEISDPDSRVADAGSSSCSSAADVRTAYDESLLFDYLDFMAGAPGLLPHRPTSAGYPGEPPLVQGVRAHARSRQIMDLQDEARRRAASGQLSEAGRCLTEALEARAGNMGPQDAEVLVIAIEKATAVLNSWACRALSWAAASTTSSQVTSSCSTCCPPFSSAVASGGFPLAGTSTFSVSSRQGAPTSVASLSALGICAIPFPPLVSASASASATTGSWPSGQGQGQGQGAVAFELLKQAEALEVRLQIRLPPGARARCRALIFHHFAVYYRLRSKLSAALAYAVKAATLAQQAHLPTYSMVPIETNRVALLISNGRSKKAAELCEDLLKVLSTRQDSAAPRDPVLEAPPSIVQQQTSQTLDDLPTQDSRPLPDPAAEAFAPGSMRHAVFYVLTLYNSWVANWRLGSRKSVDKMLRADHFVHRHLGASHSLAARVHQAVELSMAVRDRTSSSVSTLSSFSSPRTSQQKQQQFHQLQQGPNITDRGPWFGRTILPPAVPPSERIPLHRKLKQMSVKESVYGRRRHHFAEGAAALKPLGRPTTGWGATCSLQDHTPMVGSPRAV